MKTLSEIVPALLIVAGALISSGCRHGESGAHGHDHESGEAAHNHEEGVTFTEGRGLFVPAATAKFIGLQIADVEERNVDSVFQFSARIYRASNESQLAALQPVRLPDALASGSVSPDDAARLTEGQSVSVQKSGNDAPLEGRIVSLKRGIEKASGQVEVIVAVRDPQLAVTLDDFVSVTIPLQSESKVIGVPRAALLRTTEGDFVYTVSGAHFVRTEVKLGVVNDELAEVVDGLYAGDQIVTRPVMTLWLAELQSLRGGKSCAHGH